MKLSHGTSHTRVVALGSASLTRESGTIGLNSMTYPSNNFWPCTKQGIKLLMCLMWDMPGQSAFGAPSPKSSPSVAAFRFEGRRSFLRLGLNSEERVQKCRAELSFSRSGASRESMPPRNVSWNVLDLRRDCPKRRVVCLPSHR